MSTALAMAGVLAAATASGGGLPIPSPDPLGYPVPPILLQALSYFTLTLHFLAMNLTVGSVFIYLWLRIARKQYDDRLARYLRDLLPLGTSYLITFGIPPLLFVQVLYGQMFYSSSILLGFHWILVIPLVVFLYGVFYYQKLVKNPEHPGVLLLSVLAAMALLGVGFFFVNNITLSVSPEKWMGLYAKSPGGRNLNMDDPTLFARWLLILAPGFTVAGVAILFRGVMMLKWGLTEEGRHNHRIAVSVAVVGMVLEAVAGVWILSAMPDDLRSHVTSAGLAKLLLGLGTAMASVGLVLVFLGRYKASWAYPLMASLAFFLALAPLVALRDVVRQEQLRPFFSLAEVPVHTQWGMAGLFAVFLVAGLLLLLALHMMVVPGLIAGRRAELRESA
ncbi:MAG TPA: hypothetical protein PKM43_09380 [Verrucomicrobiota bacterium]|nr:hypothetical protein [Verrucomicrobiota bacterium]